MWTKALLITVGWISVTLGLIGIFLPVLPTTPFMILAASCFAKSSARFHQWLITSPLFGPIIQDWQDSRSIKHATKCWALLVTFATFCLSIYMVDMFYVRLFLIAMMTICLTCIYRLPVKPEVIDREV